MCLHTKWEEPKKATKPITIYKILRRDFMAPYQGFQYKLGKVYSTELRKSSDPASFDDKAGGWKQKMINNNIKLHSISEGFHSALTKKRLIESEIQTIQIICKGVIPKGAKYYKDGTGLIVSSKIKIIKQVKYELPDN